MKVSRNHFAEALATLRGALFLIVTFGFVFIMLGLISLERIRKYGPLEHFKLGNTEVPKFQGAGASNLDILILCIVGLLALLVGVVIRYFYYRDKLDFLRSKGMNDLDRNGKIDSFADSHIDDL